MARSKSNPSTSVTFRMPDECLQSIDELAAKNSHDRTSEIIGACKHWVEIDGAVGVDVSTKERISEIQEHIASLEESIQKIESAVRQIEENNTILLRIIETMAKK